MLTYREMTVEDLPVAFAVRLATRENVVTLDELEQDYGVTPESLARGLRSNLRGWLCEDDGNVVGFAIGDRSNGEVQVVAVLPEHEGRGIGGALLAQVHDWLFACGHDEVWLRANPEPSLRASGFYRHLGWRRSGRMLGGDEVLTMTRLKA